MISISTALHRHDLPFYLHRTKVSEARKIISEESDEKITGKCLLKYAEDCSCFRCLVNAYCTYYLQIRRKPACVHAQLDNKGWDRLGLFVEKNLHTMNGLSLEEGVEFIKTTMSTNQSQVMGLPSRLHFWNFPKNHD